MQPERAVGRLMRMKNELRIAAGLVLAVALAGCGATSPQPQPRRSWPTAWRSGSRW